MPETRRFGPLEEDHPWEPAEGPQKDSHPRSEPPRVTQLFFEDRNGVLVVPPEVGR